jgi:hypothetical protein
MKNTRIAAHAETGGESKLRLCQSALTRTLTGALDTQVTSNRLSAALSGCARSKEELEASKPFGTRSRIAAPRHKFVTPLDLIRLHGRTSVKDRALRTHLLSDCRPRLTIIRIKWRVDGLETVHVRSACAESKRLGLVLLRPNRCRSPESELGDRARTREKRRWFSQGTR